MAGVQGQRAGAIGAACLRAVAAVALFTTFANALPAKVQGRNIVVDGKPLHMKGVNWNPVPRGTAHPDGLDYAGFVDLDAELMQRAGINVLRTYEPLVNRTVLDKLWARGIQVVNTVWANGKDPLENITARVEAVKDHKAILMWSVGNEWNFNRCYDGGLNFGECMRHIRKAVQMVKALDSTHPVATVYGTLPTRDIISQLPEVDIWGINHYDGLHMQGMLWRWSQLSQLPVFLGEYGADAYNADKGRLDEEAQAHATTVLTQKIVDYSSVTGGMCAGGFVFELADEWWKDGSGCNSTQDVGGIAPGGGPHPDRTFNEEWWGLADIDRNPRLAFKAYAGTPLPTASAAQGPQAATAHLACTAAGCAPEPYPESGCAPAAASPALPPAPEPDAASAADAAAGHGGAAAPASKPGLRGRT